MSAEVAIGEPGAASADAAAETFSEEIRSAARDKQHPQELRELMSPEKVRYSESKDTAPDGFEFFDIPSKGRADLEGRVVVQHFEGDGWKVVGAVQCTSLLVKDLEMFDQRSREIFGDPAAKAKEKRDNGREGQ